MRPTNHIIVSSTTLAATAVAALMATSAHASAPAPKLDSLVSIIADKAPMKPSPEAAVPCAIGNMPYEILDSKLIASKDTNKDKKGVATNVDQKTIKFCVMGEYDSATLNKSLGFGQKHVPYYNIIGGYSFTLKRYLTKDEAIDVLQQHVTDAQKNKQETIPAGFAFNNKGMPRAIGKVSGLPKPSLEHIDDVREAIREADGTMTLARLSELQQQLASAKQVEPIVTFASLKVVQKPATIQLAANDLQLQTPNIRIRPAVIRWSKKIDDVDASVEVASATNTGVMQIRARTTLSQEKQKLLLAKAEQEFASSEVAQDKPSLQHFVDTKTSTPIVTYAANTLRAPSQRRDDNSDAHVSDAVYHYDGGTPPGGSPPSGGGMSGGNSGIGGAGSLPPSGFARVALNTSALMAVTNQSDNFGNYLGTTMLNALEAGRNIRDSINTKVTAAANATNDFTQNNSLFLEALAFLGVVSTALHVYGKSSHTPAPFTGGLDSDKNYRGNRKRRTTGNFLQIGEAGMPDLLPTIDQNGTLNELYLAREMYGVEPAFASMGGSGNTQPWGTQNQSTNLATKVQVAATHVGNHLWNNRNEIAAGMAAGIAVKSLFAIAAASVTLPAGGALLVGLTSAVTAGIASKMAVAAYREIKREGSNKFSGEWWLHTAGEVFNPKKLLAGAAFGLVGGAIGTGIAEGVGHVAKFIGDHVMPHAQTAATHLATGHLSIQTQVVDPVPTTSAVPTEAVQPSDLHSMLQSNILGSDNAALAHKALAAMDGHHSISAMARVRDIVGQLAKSNVHDAAALNQAALDYANNNHIESGRVIDVLRGNQSYLNAKLAM